MKIAVLGLGVEGKKAVKSLKVRDYRVYASDLNDEVSMDDLKEILDESEFDLGFHDLEKIQSADAVIVSPGLWKSDLTNQIKDSKKTLPDVLQSHKSIFTIGVTGTNGKTTTTYMIKEILENSGLKVLVGGNAGGGFEGYAEVVLQSHVEEYDVILVEICDMTLEFCDHCFDIDMVVLTNLERDHMDVHGSLDNYREKIDKFLESKNVILNKNDKSLYELSKSAQSCNFYDECDIEIQLVGKFNKLNAGAAQATAQAMNIDEAIIENSLMEFDGIEGRIKSYYINESEIFAGKTDNAHATSVVLEERKFKAIFLGTPRKNETWRLDIIDEASKTHPEVIVLFPGLENTIDQALNRLKYLNFKGKVLIITDLDKLLEIIMEMTQTYKYIFIGGNGQNKILEIQKKLDVLAKG
ncbi:MAG: Mur ligase family protein [Methanobacteriaceae archaeon]|nr:Mur ligase family protein [Methanobacteriaceae archaeon]MDP2835722.1 Mur ligase family protein [Methanobacteriaceae archaeon]MDP3033756.1 Mur ligase family protein [Methanobacteriaceae archaeon]MDP3484018.1 Mur ligase family protein [Methanobacteriaceae archaeon]MDP3624530.1 Mur ligase family protein [Methanobacteriaceae archaeon]